MASMQAPRTAATLPLTVSPGAAGAALAARLDARPATDAPDPGALILTCANCGAPMDERKCKLVCTCGYFLSCSDYD